ncbi:hypothetical protein SEPCBS119000_002852 [Sporothrix epigloea]|uniref:DOC domain-containing protein n=1 Tax=Sporothrix epigloea TaxID=1892477 RepID=A0ABP0DIF6_9PEZI
MNPNRPLRGPRRAARRGEEALRYDQIDSGDQQVTDRPEDDQLSQDQAEIAHNRPRWNLSAGRLRQEDTHTNQHHQAEREMHNDQRTQDQEWPYPASDMEDVDEVHGRFNQEQAEAETDGEEEAHLYEHDEMHVLRHTEDPYYQAYLYGNSVNESHENANLEEEEEEVDEDEGDEHVDEEDEEDADMHGPEDGMDANSEMADDEDDDNDDVGIPFDPVLLGLKEINNLAHFSVSSHKPGNGVDQLLHDDVATYWQSDGPQPHLLTIHFLRRVEIRAIRFYIDYNQDESYTPTSIVLSAGTGHHDLLEFASLSLTTPVGWQDVDLSGVGGGADGQSLCCWIVQVKIKENHQNGKDTHIRGIKLYALDENAAPMDGALDELARIKRRDLQLTTARSNQVVLTEEDDYLFEQLIMQSPGKLSRAPERSGSMANFLRDEEIR